MEDDDDEEDFELGVYGQREANQDAENNRLCYHPVREEKEKYMPVQDDTKLEDGDTNQLSQGVFVVLSRFSLHRNHVMVCMGNIRCLCDFLDI
jgi:hypothetical protein